MTPAEMASTYQTRICDLPNEVVLTIFYFLPIPDLARCARISKQWHTIVTRYTHLWKGKDYRSDRSPRESVETRAVLKALPPFQEVIIESFNGYRLHISYPRLVLSRKYVRVMKNFQRVRCEYLSTRVDIADDILFYRSTIDFERLQHLDILQMPAPRTHSASYVIRNALRRCPSLKHLRVCTRVSAGYLDTVEKLGQLQSLVMDCPRLRAVCFLRHCSGALRELQLLSCEHLPSRELAKLQQLRRLRTLRLGGWRFEQGDLAAAVEALADLESLQLHGCGSVRDLTFLQCCGRLRQLRITYSAQLESAIAVTPGGQQLRLRLPADADEDYVGVDGVYVAAEHLPAALSQLQQLGLASSCLAFLAALRGCSQLRHICCEFVRELDSVHVSNVRLHISLTGPT